MVNTALVEHYDQIAKSEAVAILAPMTEKVTQKYLFVDRKRAAEMLCISIAVFDDLKKLPQIRAIERRLPNCTKVLYKPKELEQAILSVMQ
ncbi:hypothetical protein DA799_11760 [Lactiplantibacillus plantarum]|uniref:hypothetical protein n=1 Tax=Lactiplantibacillus plantarum TaxID=1590 RepID=UPI000D2F9F0A|nr:hypothetical protein [Lactiplantibacillus plantarum]PTM30210.1 hypothetical protein DA799_11760 [Lactiplantibacillus plantarum]